MNIYRSKNLFLTISIKNASKLFYSLKILSSIDDDENYRYNCKNYSNTKKKIRFPI